MIADPQDLRQAAEAGETRTAGGRLASSPARRRGCAETSRRRRGGGTRYPRRGADRRERCDGARRVPCRTGPEPCICRNGAGVPPARKAPSRRRRRAFYSVAPWRNPRAVVPGDDGGPRSRSDTCGTRSVRAVGVPAFPWPEACLRSWRASIRREHRVAPQAGAQRRSRNAA